MRNLERCALLASLLVLVIGGTSAKASTETIQPYPSVRTSGYCIPYPQSVCFDVPAGAVRVTLSIEDDRSAHVTGTYGLFCGSPDGTCPDGVTTIATVCDAVTLDLAPEVAHITLLLDDPADAVIDSQATDGGCASPTAFFTTGHVAATWLFPSDLGN